MDFFAQCFVEEYNLKMDPIIIYGCDCYNQYRTEGGPEETMKLLCKEGLSYTACIKMGYAKHRTLPIMIGSNIDESIRPGVDKTYQCGAFVLCGALKILTSFITNNLRSGHVYRPSNIYKWRFNEEDDGKGYTVNSLQYPDSGPGSVVSDDGRTIRFSSVRRRMEKRNGMRGYAIKEDRMSFLDSADLIADRINDTSPINKMTDNQHRMTLDEYLDYFDACVEHYPELDDLSNKTIITASSIFESVIQNCKNYPHSISKLNTMINGNLFYVLSSKSVSFVKNDEFKTAYVPMEGHRISMIHKLIANVKRHISHGVRNSNALKLPRDANHFICPLNVKEMKNAGETMALGQFVIIAPKVPLEELLPAIAEYDAKNSAEAKNNEPLLQICIEGWLTKFQITNAQVMELKRRFILVTMNFGNRYLMIANNGHLPVKYSPKYRMFVGVYEAYHNIRDAFDEYTEFAKFSPFALSFHRTILHMPPAKATVSINNLKGACCTINNRSELYTFLYTIGFTNSALMMPLNDSSRFDGTMPMGDFECASFNDPTKFMMLVKNLNCTEMYKLAHLKDQMPMPRLVALLLEAADWGRKQNRKKFSSELLPPHIFGANTFEETGQTYRGLLKSDPDYHFQNIQDALNRAFGLVHKKRLSEPKIELVPEKSRKRKKGGPPIPSVGSTTSSSSSLALVDNTGTAESMLSPNYEYKLNFNNESSDRIVLYTALCNLNCDTVEDGIILDETFHKNSPLKLYSVTLSLKVYAYNESTNYSKKCSKLNSNGTYIYYPANVKMGKVINFGTIVSDFRLKIQKRRAIKIEESQIKNTFRYKISMDDPLPQNKVIDSFFKVDHETDKAIFLLHYHYKARLGVGTKMANLHGQKGVVSAVKDLSVYKFWDSTGRIVHPQVLFSKQSLVGRMTSSQTINMINSEKLAFNEYGAITAPLTFFVHQIEAKSKCKIMFPKNDLMTAENGFLSNGLVATMKIMTEQYPLNESLNDSSFLLELLKLKKVHIDISPDISSVLNEIEESVGEKRRQDMEAVIEKNLRRNNILSKRRQTKHTTGNALLNALSELSREQYNDSAKDDLTTTTTTNEDYFDDDDSNEEDDLHSDSLEKEFDNECSSIGSISSEEDTLTSTEDEADEDGDEDEDEKNDFDEGSTFN